MRTRTMKEMIGYKNKSTGTVPMIRSSLRQSNHPPDCCWPSTNCTRRVCDSCNRPATVEATPAMRPKEAYPKVLAEKEKKVENRSRADELRQLRQFSEQLSRVVV